MRLSVSRRGRSVLLSAPLCMVIGWLLGYQALAAFGTAGMLALGFALVTVAIQPRLAAERHITPVRVTRGEPAVSVVTMKNEGRLRAFRLMVEDGVGDVVTRHVVSSLRSGHTETTTYVLPTEKRGVFDVVPLRVGREDPLGLLFRRQTFAEAQTLIVHPRVNHVDPRPAGQHRDVEGATREGAPEGGITFYGLREYQAGDDLRHIHWPVSAHTGQLMVRQFVDTGQPTTTLILDNREVVHDDQSFEVAIEIAASLAAASLEANLPVELRTADGASFQSSQPSARHLFLDALSGIHLHRDADLLAPLRTLSAGLERNTLIVVTAMPKITTSLESIGRLGTAFESVILVNVRKDQGALLSMGHRFMTIDVGSVEEFASAWSRSRAT